MIKYCKQNVQVKGIVFTLIHGVLTNLTVGFSRHTLLLETGRKIHIKKYIKIRVKESSSIKRFDAFNKLHLNNAF